MHTLGRTILLSGASISVGVVATCIAVVSGPSDNAVPEEIAALAGPEKPESPEAQAPELIESLAEIEAFASSMMIRGPVSFYYIDDLAIRDPEPGRLTDRGVILREWSGVAMAGPSDAWTVHAPMDRQFRATGDGHCLTPGR